ncbi:MAG: DsrE/DsrF/DrsH-like family protein [Candidatus Methanomethyliaceae archaeon]|nr:DsrE/DsrF/DrsH-like family protein [Candidatus Methanomethyliaceae archaeon]
MEERREKNEKKVSRILYIQTSGVDTPERLYAPFILAMTAKAMDIEASIFFMIKGITPLRQGVAEGIKIGNFPSLKEVMDQAVKAGVKLYACAQSCELLNMPKTDLVEYVTVAGAATVNDLVLDADATLCF